jgi:hypothetical protein
VKRARRAFLGSMAALPLAKGALAQTPSPVPAPAPSPAPAAQALAQIVEQRWGALLDPAWKGEIASAIEGNLKAGERLRTVNLGNGDEPVTVFEARPPRPRK